MPFIDLETLTDKDKAIIQVTQLKKETTLTRAKVSVVAEELKDHIQAGLDEDILVKGIPEDKNPFKEKGGCVVC